MDSESDLCCPCYCVKRFSFSSEPAINHINSLSYLSSIGKRCYISLSDCNMFESSIRMTIFV